MLSTHATTSHSNPLPAHFPGVAQPNASDINAKLDLVFARLPKDVPWYQPKHVAPLLGITDRGFTKHCANFRLLQNWRGGNYRFMTDDPEHMRILRELVRVILWSGLKLPTDLRPSRLQ
jgi:hypothetical protein